MTVTMMSSSTQLSQTEASVEFRAKRVPSSEDEWKYFLLRKKKEDFDILLVDIMVEHLQYKLSAIHLQAINDWLLHFPSILISVSAGLVSVLGLSSTVPINENSMSPVMFAMTIMCILSTLLQMLMKQLNYGVRGGMHQACGIQLHKLYYTVNLSSREAQYSSILNSLQTGGKLSVGPNLLSDVTVSTSHHIDENEGESKTDSNRPTGDAVQGSADMMGKKNAAARGDDNDDDKTKETISSITTQFRQALDGATTPLPIKIASTFGLMHSRIEVVNKSMSNDSPQAAIAWDKVKLELYSHLSELIISSRGFPFRLPDSSWAVDTTLKEFKEILLHENDQSDAFLVSALLKRAGGIDKETSYNNRTIDEATYPTTTAIRKGLAQTMIDV